MMVDWIEGIWVEFETTVFQKNQGEPVIVWRAKLCTASSLLQFELDISAPHSRPA